MFGYWYVLRHKWRKFRNPPVVLIERFGQRTSRPQVIVSVHGVGGSQTVYAWVDDVQGNACATMYGQGLADIMQRRLIDYRHSTHPCECIPFPGAVENRCVNCRGIPK